MSKKLILTMIAVFALAVGTALAGTEDAAKVDPKAPNVKAGGMAMGHRYANSAAVCGCGKVFVPSANTKSFTFEGKDYACCTDECHKKLSSLAPADAAKATEAQMAKLQAAAPTAAPTTSPAATKDPK